MTEQNIENHNLTPRIVECIDCHEPFVLRSQEREWYLERLLSEPKRCPECRQRRRRQSEVLK